jgi:hypothetical protein
MTVSDLIRLLRRHAPTLRVLVADEVGIYGMHRDDVRLIETTHSSWGARSLLISPIESKRSSGPRYQRQEKLRPIERLRARQTWLAQREAGERRGDYSQAEWDWLTAWNTKAVRG